MLQELRRALDRHLRWLERPVTRVQAHSIIKAAFAAEGIENDGRLWTHTLRKTFARSVYKNSGNDIIVLKAALNHSDVAVA